MVQCSELCNPISVAKAACPAPCASSWKPLRDKVRQMEARIWTFLSSPTRISELTMMIQWKEQMCCIRLPVQMKLSTISWSFTTSHQTLNSVFLRLEDGSSLSQSLSLSSSLSFSLGRTFSLCVWRCMPWMFVSLTLLLRKIWIESLFKAISLLMYGHFWHKSVHVD